MSGILFDGILFLNDQLKNGMIPGCILLQGKAIFVFISVILLLSLNAKPLVWLIIPCEPSVIDQIFGLLIFKCILQKLLYNF